MKRGPFLFVGILGVLLVLGTACGGAAAPTPTKAPAAKATPTVAGKPAATPIPAVKPAASPTPVTQPAAGPALEIGSAADPKLEFDKNKLSAKVGTTVVLRFKNNSKTVQHNWVLVKGGTKDKDEVANAGATAGPANDWIPRNDARILANTKLIDPGKTGEVQFTAPAAGMYQFVCTFPGHNAAGMFGEFTATQ